MSSHWLGRATLPEGYLTAVLGEPSRSPETWSVTSSVVGPSMGARVSPRGYSRRRITHEGGSPPAPSPLSSPSETPSHHQGRPCVNQCFGNIEASFTLPHVQRRPSGGQERGRRMSDGGG